MKCGLGVLVLLLGVQGASEARATNTLRVMSFNLRYASAAADLGSWKQWANETFTPQRREFVYEVLANRQPELVGFQEGEDVQLDDLAAHLPAHYAFQRQRPSGGGGAENAAMMWNTNVLELLDRGVFALGPSPGGGYWNNPPATNFDPYLFFPDMGLGFPRLALWGRFRLRATGQQFHFYTTHFDFNATPQVNSAALISDDARTRCARIPASPLAIVVGDFNSTQADNDWRLFTGAYTNNGITGDFADAWWQVHQTWTDSGTMHGYSGGTRPATDRIDWILHRGGFQAVQMSIVNESTTATNRSTLATSTMYASDHYPVLALLQFPPIAEDYDRDGIPDARELATATLLPAIADSDNDGLLDGEEDLDGDGSVDGGETDPRAPGDTQKPTDIRNHQMDGIRDHTASLLASHGLDLHARFDGRYLYVATHDAGEGSDHFLFIATNATDAVSAPWAKAGSVARWCAYLADENDSGYASWYDAAGARITNALAARQATYFQNGGSLEGVIDLGRILGAGFTAPLFLAAAPYGSADGGALFAPAQAPEGNGDGNLLGTNEYVRLDPGDMDGDGIGNAADPDRDGDGLPDAWELAHGLSPDSTNGIHGHAGDPDADGAANAQEWAAATRPTDPTDSFRISAMAQGPTNPGIGWAGVHGKLYQVWITGSGGLSDAAAWSCIHTSAPITNFPTADLSCPTAAPGTTAPIFYRLSVTP